MSFRTVGTFDSITQLDTFAAEDTGTWLAIIWIAFSWVSIETFFTYFTVFTSGIVFTFTFSGFRVTRRTVIVTFARDTSKNVRGFLLIFPSQNSQFFSWVATYYFQIYSTRQMTLLRHQVKMMSRYHITQLWETRENVS